MAKHLSAKRTKNIKLTLLRLLLENRECMKWEERYKELHMSLITGKITEEEFIRLNSEGNQTDAEISIRLLNKAFDDKNADAVEEAIREASPLKGFSNKFSEIFCKLLQADWHYKHEDIARVLQEM